MQSINEIRQALSQIPNATYEAEPQGSAQGDDPNVRRVWNGVGSEPPSSLADNYQEASASEDPGEGPQAEDLFEFPAEIDSGDYDEAVSGERGRDLFQSALVYGVEGYAWYVPFHRSEQWGIYIRATSVMLLAHYVFGTIKAPLSVRQLMAIRALHQHELFHFAAEYMCAQMEIIHSVAVHKSAQKLKEQYGYNPLEEKLGNASMIRSFWGRGWTGKTRQLREFVLKFGPGYNEGGSVTREDAFTADCTDLVRRYAGCVPEGAGITSRFFDADRLLPTLPADWRYCPIHWVQDETRLDLPPILLDFFGQIETITESDKFQRQLRKQPEPVQQRWPRVKQRLQVTTAANDMDFKPWPKTKHPDGRVFSVRVRSGFRAHLLFRKKIRVWEALSIGDHKAMGHG